MTGSHLVFNEVCVDTPSTVASPAERNGDTLPRVCAGLKACCQCLAGDDDALAAFSAAGWRNGLVLDSLRGLAVVDLSPLVSAVADRETASVPKRNGCCPSGLRSEQ